MKEITLPKLGESIVSATVVQWFKKEGDHVALDEPLLEVSTDKVNSEIPSPFAGILHKILAREDEEVEVGAPLALMVTADATVRELTPVEKIPCPLKEENYSPAVLRAAEQAGIKREELQKMVGSGEGGRVTKKDIEHFAAQKSPQTVGEERVAMSKVRKAIAAQMVRSFYEAPHASFVTEIDVTEPMEMIAEQKEKFFEMHGVKLTISSFIIQALAKAAVQYPMLNASLEEETIVMKRFIHVGIAVNIEGGLIVPVIKNCEERNIVSIAKELALLSQKARSGKLSPDDVSGGTITLTNFGMTGTLIGVPIIHYPEVAIMGVGAVQKRVVVREDDAIAIRQMAYISITFDHRVVDGVYVCNFLNCFKQHIEARS